MRSQRLSHRPQGGPIVSRLQSGRSDCRIGSMPSGAPVADGIRHLPVILFLCTSLVACAGNPLPPPNSIRATYDRGSPAIQVYISNAQMPRDAYLVDVNGTRYALILTPLSGPHVNYSTPPTIGLGLGGFGGNVGGGGGVGFPLGRPHPTSVDNQFVASSRILPPPDYLQRWSQYHVVVDLGTQALEVPAPSPG